MLLAQGDLQQYELLKKSTCETYLLKLENFVEDVEQKEKQANELKNKRR